MSRIFFIPHGFSLLEVRLQYRVSERLGLMEAEEAVA
jgi:hypothetical protein